MGKRTGTALRSIQWFVRAIEFCCAAIILALFSYFLATLASNALSTPDWIRAVAGIAGIAVVYTIITLILLFCVAGHPFLSSVFIALDICFAAAFIYLAAANRHGSSSCDGYVDTALGTGNSDTNAVDDGKGGVIQLAPSLRQACKMQTACLAVSVVGIFFFIFSAILEFLLIRHRRKEKRFGPSPVNGYTSGYGKSHLAGGTTGTGGGGGGFSKRFLSRRSKRRAGTDLSDALPEHAHPDDLHRQDSYGTEQTRVNTSHGDATYVGNPADALPPTHNRPAPPPPPHVSHVNTTGGYGNNYAGVYKPEPVSRVAASDFGAAYTNNTHHMANGPATNGSVAANVHAPPARFPPGNYRYDDGVYDRV